MRRIAYFFLVSRPALAAAPAPPLARFQVGTTQTGTSAVSRYGYPTAPFGQPADYGSTPMRQDGAEKLYTVRLTEPAVNLGAAVIGASNGSLVDPWLLGAKDENSVQGYAGTPVSVNPLTFSYQIDIGAAGATFPRPATYYLAVDAGRDPFTGRLLAGRFLLQSWVNDVLPPLIAPVTTRVSAGRPTLVVRVLDIGGGGVFDPGSGIDVLSLTIGYRNVLVGAAAYDPASGIAVFPLPTAAPALRPGSLSLAMLASDNQEAKNVNVAGDDIAPNTGVRAVARARRERTRRTRGSSPSASHASSGASVSSSSRARRPPYGRCTSPSTAGGSPWSSEVRPASTRPTGARPGSRRAATSCRRS